MDPLPSWKNPSWSQLKSTLVVLTLIIVLNILAFLMRAAWIVLVEIPATRKRKHLSLASTLNRKQQKRSLPIKTLIVLGSGGHTAEMLSMTKHLDPAHYHITYIKAATDTTSRQRLDDDNVTVHDIPRSREVGQSYLSSIFSTLRAQWYCLWLVGRLAPDLILCNGPGTCLPVCLAALFFRVTGRPNSIVFCESYCRVETLSLTGKLLYPLADMFVVHWPELHQKFPRTVLVSTFVADNKVDNDDDDDKKNH
jgi:beta-1,4-N-acetylglucosaminyltransferase